MQRFHIFDSKDLGLWDLGITNDRKPSWHLPDVANDYWKSMLLVVAVMVYIYIYVYIYIHTYIYVYTHTHIQMSYGGILV